MTEGKDWDFDSYFTSFSIPWGDNFNMHSNILITTTLAVERVGLVSLEIREPEKFEAFSYPISWILKFELNVSFGVGIILEICFKSSPVTWIFNEESSSRSFDRDDTVFTRIFLNFDSNHLNLIRFGRVNRLVHSNSEIEVHIVGKLFILLKPPLHNKWYHNFGSFGITTTIGRRFMFS